MIKTKNKTIIPLGHIKVLQHSNVRFLYLYITFLFCAVALHCTKI